MKKLFAILALALCSFAFVSCQNDTPKSEDYILAADKTTVNPGDVITFTLTGSDLANKNWGMCDFETCRAIKFENGKFVYAYTVPTTAPKGVYDYYFYSIPKGTEKKVQTNTIKITINELPK